MLMADGCSKDKEECFIAKLNCLSPEFPSFFFNEETGRKHEAEFIFFIYFIYVNIL